MKIERDSLEHFNQMMQGEIENISRSLGEVRLLMDLAEIKFQVNRQYEGERGQAAVDPVLSSRLA